MAPQPCSLLSIAPYRILPATTGGHLGIVSMHDALGRLCEDHMIATADNAPDDAYAFHMHRLMEPTPIHYLPYRNLSKMIALGQRYKTTHIFCDHPYMAPTAIALSRKLQVPWFLRSHNIEADRFHMLGKPWWRALAWFERMVLRRADGTFFITPEDRDRAITHYKLNPAHCHLAAYGTNLSAAPTGHATAKQELATQLGLDPAIPWFYFLGVHSYQPNADAVGFIAKEIAPRLLAAGQRCHILIGGKSLPPDIQAAVQATNGLVQYQGFIDNLDVFIKACDVMLNPVLTGGGIKTKAVEALGYNKVVVSTVNGAAGILPEVCGDNLLLSADYDWAAFTENCIKAIARTPAIPQAFYQHYYWGNIAQHVLNIMRTAS